MEAIYLNHNKDTVKRIFMPEEASKRLSMLGEIPYVNKEELLADPGKYKDVKYVFSTWGMVELTEEEIKCALPSLEAVFYGAGTVKYFAEPYMKSGVRIYSAAQANGVPVAEYVVSQIILANKGYYQAERQYKKPLGKKSYDQAHAFADNRPGNYRAKIGLIGAGVIGKMVIERLKDYALDVYVTDPFYSKEALAALGATKVELPWMFENCDVISNHLPNIPETVDMLNYDLFSKMKPYTTFLNTGRGAQVVEKDLVRAMKEDKTRFAILDVTREEPVKWNSPFHFTKNILLTPHIAGSLSNEVLRMGDYMYQAFESHIKGEESPYEVTLEMLKNMA